MPTLTLAIPKELKSEMEKFPELNWSEIARKAIAENLAEYRLFKSIAEKARGSDKDVLELGRKINGSLYRRYKKKFSELP